MRRFERIGFPAERVSLDYELNWFANNDDFVTSMDHADWQYANLCHKASFVTVYAFLIDDSSLAREWAARALEFAEQHFWGDWRDIVPTGNASNGPPSREYQDINCAWKLPFHCSLLCASCLGIWDWLSRLGRFLRDDVRLNIDQTESNRAWYLLVAGTLRGRPWSEMADFFDKTQKSPQKREKLLVRLIHSIVEGTEVDRAGATKEYFTHFKRSERKSQYFDIMLPWDASFLVHYAKHVGKPLPVPADMADFIIDLGEG